MKNKDILIPISVILSIIGVLIICWYLYSVDFLKLLHNQEINNLGQVGDFIGGMLGALFSLVGTLLLIATLKTQREEIRNNSDFLYQQQFETSFFSLLNNLNEHIKSIEYTGVNGNFSGKKYFIHCQSEIVSVYELDTNRNNRLIKIINTYEIFHLEHRQYLAPYFRILYRIFNYIDESNLKDELKFHYSKIVRATLSESELFLLHYSSLTNIGQNFRKLILKYNILKHLPISSQLELKTYFHGLNSNEFAGFKYITDEIANAIKSSIADTKHIKYRIKYTNINVATFNLTDGIRIEIAISKIKSFKNTFFENLSADFRIQYLQDLLWEICVFSNMGTLINSLEDIEYKKELLSNAEEDTIRLEMNFQDGSRVKILKDLI